MGHWHWEVVNRSSLPASVKTIQAIWSFKRNRFPDSALDKFKARLCAHDGMQQWQWQWGVNYRDTYAHVVNWISVRFLLIPSEIAGLESRVIDFVRYLHLHFRKQISMYQFTWSCPMEWKLMGNRSSIFFSSEKASTGSNNL